jgi:hypothetical protein
MERSTGEATFTREWLRYQRQKDAYREAIAGCRDANMSPVAFAPWQCFGKPSALVLRKTGTSPLFSQNTNLISYP